MQSLFVFAITVAFGLVLSSAFLPFQLNEIYADQSETNTEQGLSQENVGSGESVNTNCGQNIIESGASALACGEGITFPTPPVGGAVLTLSNCVESPTSTTTRLTCHYVTPDFPDSPEGTFVCGKIGGVYGPVCTAFDGPFFIPLTCESFTVPPFPTSVTCN